ncbi:MAG: HAD hydrolase-like protein [Sphingomonadaceae bacterium]|nr:HAD hydrolase-like protein [Sphingomonadaceae bacterium]
MRNPRTSGDDTRARIASARGFIFDMDGTIALGDRTSGGHEALPGAIELIARIKRDNIPVRIFTNGTAKPPAAYAASLRGAGFDVEDEEMMTPSSSTAAWLVARGINRVRVLGTAGTSAPLLAKGIEVIGPSEQADGVQAVYLGWHREFTFRDLEAAVQDVLAGAVAVTASNVPFFATADGRAMGTSYAMNAVVRAYLGRLPRILGKPSRDAFFCALASMGLKRRDASDVVVVGDDPALEMRMANAVGAISVGVATGLSGLAALKGLPERDRPMLALSGVGELLEMVG